MEAVAAVQEVVVLVLHLANMVEFGTIQKVKNAVVSHSIRNLSMFVMEAHQQHLQEQAQHPLPQHPQRLGKFKTLNLRI